MARIAGRMTNSPLVHRSTMVTVGVSSAMSLRTLSCRLRVLPRRDTTTTHTLTRNPTAATVLVDEKSTTSPVGTLPREPAPTDRPRPYQMMKWLLSVATRRSWKSLKRRGTFEKSLADSQLWIPQTKRKTSDNTISEWLSVRLHRSTRPPPTTPLIAPKECLFITHLLRSTPPCSMASVQSFITQRSTRC